MSTAQKIAMGIVGIAFATTLLLPKRQTPQVLNAFFTGGRGLLSTAMGTGKTV